jgi:hypothetical protein
LEHKNREEQQTRKMKARLCRSVKELGFPFKYLSTNSFFRRAPASAEAEKYGAKNSGSQCAKKKLPLAKIARQVDCCGGF